MTASALERFESQPLAEVATPELYQRNLFRVLGVPVGAGVKEIRRRQKRLDMMRKLGTADSEPVCDGLLALPETDDDAVRSALEHVNDPKARFVDEFFWFWPMDGEAANDSALLALEQGDLNAAIRIWSVDDGDLEQRAVAVHNRAVLNHLVAMEYEKRVLTAKKEGATLSPTETVLKHTERLWQRALEDWRATIHDDAFWHTVKQRVAEHDDKQLTTGFVHRLRQALPEAILRTSADLALRLAEVGDADKARQQVAHMQAAWNSNNEVMRALRDALAPVRDRLENLATSARERAKNDQEHAAWHAWELLNQADPGLALVDALLPENDPVRTAIHDDVVDAANLCQVAYGNKTEDWKGTLDLIDRILLIVAGEHQKERIEGNREVVQKNLDASQCFFCGEEQADPDVGIEVKMYGDVRQSYEQLKWRLTTVTVPRCRHCAELRSANADFGSAAFKVGAAFGFLVVFLTIFINFGKSGTDMVGLVFLSAVVGLIGAFLAGRFLELSFPEEHGFPEIKKLRKDGWRFGESPPEASN
ncbi:MAG: hypothetical protein U9P00_14860 [Pseudomonadota bacterium]|nr:hypothetical protein [Pseudomonadota bacterium]